MAYVFHDTEHRQFGYCGCYNDMLVALARQPCSLFTTKVGGWRYLWSLEVYRCRGVRTLIFFSPVQSCFVNFESESAPEPAHTRHKQSQSWLMLSSFFLLNMKRLVILKQQRKKTDGFATIRMKQNT